MVGFSPVLRLSLMVLTFITLQYNPKQTIRQATQISVTHIHTHTFLRLPFLGVLAMTLALKKVGMMVRRVVMETNLAAVAAGK